MGNGVVGRGNQPSMAIPFRISGKHHIHNLQASLSLPFLSYDSLHSFPLSYFQMLHHVSVMTYVST